MASDVIVKVFIDESEYKRLIKTEELYKELLSKQKELIGKGNCSCTSKEKTLSEVVAENSRTAQLKTPVPGILPDITNPYEANVTTAKPWYFLGIPPNNVDK